MVCLLPIYWLAITSFKSESNISDGPYYLPFIDFTPSLRAWNFIFSYASEKFLTRSINSAVIAGAATLLTMVCAVLLIYGLTRRHGVRHNPSFTQTVIASTLATRLLPPAVMVLPLYLMAQTLGLLDTHVFMIAVYTAINLPVAVWLLQPVFGNRATEQEDAATLDGASKLQVLLEISVPMIAPALFAVGFLVFVLCWNEYLFSAYLAGDAAMTLPPWMVGQLSIKEAQVGSEAEEWANLSAASMVMIVPLVLGTALMQRRLNKLRIGSVR